MVEVPLGVAVGDIVPHCGTEQETVQVTPLFPVSFATVAVNVVGLPAGTVETPEGATLTLIAGPAITGFPPPPQAASSITTASVESESTKDTERCMTPPQNRYVASSHGAAKTGDDRKTMPGTSGSCASLFAKRART